MTWTGRIHFKAKPAKSQGRFLHRGEATKIVSMNRERFAWTVSIVLIALLAFQIPGTLAQRDDEYAFVRELVDIHRRVAANYVDPVDEQKLRGGAINGMLDELDPFSVYVPPNRQEE